MRQVPRFVDRMLGQLPVPEMRRRRIAVVSGGLHGCSAVDHEALNERGGRSGRNKFFNRSAMTETLADLETRRSLRKRVFDNAWLAHDADAEKWALAEIRQLDEQIRQIREEEARATRRRGWTRMGAMETTGSEGARLSGRAWQAPETQIRLTCQAGIKPGPQLKEQSGQN
jgi:hypothetical protein